LNTGEVKSYAELPSSSQPLAKHKVKYYLKEGYPTLMSAYYVYTAIHISMVGSPAFIRVPIINDLTVLYNTTLVPRLYSQPLQC
jgi:hypothetical protein